MTHSKWAAPNITVRKSNGKLRACADSSIVPISALESFDYTLTVPADNFAVFAEGSDFCDAQQRSDVSTDGFFSCVLTDLSVIIQENASGASKKMPMIIRVENAPVQSAVF